MWSVGHLLLLAVFDTNVECGWRKCVDSSKDRDTELKSVAISEFAGFIFLKPILLAVDERAMKRSKVFDSYSLCRC